MSRFGTEYIIIVHVVITVDIILIISQVCDCTAVLMFDCTEEAMVERLLERGKTSGRVDDNEETIRKRFHTFQQATLPVIEHYQEHDKVRKVD